MKKLFTLIALIFTMHFAQAQVADTISVDTATSPEVRAMLELMKNKDKYVGKPFGVLIKDLPGKIIKFIDEMKIRWNDPSTGISFTFNKDLGGNSYQNAMVVVVWQSPIPIEEFRRLQHLKPWVWNPEIEDFFAPRIISDFELSRPIEVSKFGGWLKWEQRDKTKTIDQLLAEVSIK